MLTHHKSLHEHNLKGLNDAVVADICCGSGAMGFEAISRGASQACFIDINGDVLKAASNSAQTMKVADKCVFLRADVKNLPTARRSCDLIFLDPPYRDGLMNVALTEISAKGWAGDKTLICIECGAKEVVNIPDTYHILDERIYGAAKILLVLHGTH